MSDNDDDRCILKWLKEFFDSKIQYEREIVDEREKRYMTMFENSEKAIVVALRAINERLTLLNESRASIADLVANNPTRIEIRAELENVAKELKNIHSRLDRTEGSGLGKTAIWGYLVGGVGLIAMVIALINTLSK